MKQQPTEIKNTYAQEQGCDDWDDLANSVQDDLEYDQHWQDVCIRAQKAALEKAAENGLVRLNFNNLGNNNSISEKRFKIRDTAGFYDIDSDSITNPENLIR